MAAVESKTKSTTPRKTGARAQAALQAERRLKRMQRASTLLKHLSDATRLHIILMLSQGERHVGALCEELTQSQPAVSHHLALLRHGGIIIPRREGKNNIYALTEMGTELARMVKELID
jgi:DNA-binding transcriptional ArsR family regulator